MSSLDGNNLGTATGRIVGEPTVIEGERITAYVTIAATRKGGFTLVPIVFYGGRAETVRDRARSKALITVSYFVSSYERPEAEDVRDRIGVNLVGHSLRFLESASVREKRDEVQ